MVVLGVMLTAILMISLWQRRGWYPAELGAMSQSWVAANQASQRAYSD